MIGCMIAIAFFVVAELVFGGIFMLLFKQNKMAAMYAGFLSQFVIFLLCFDARIGLSQDLGQSVKFFVMAVVGFVLLDLCAIVFVFLKNKKSLKKTEAKAFVITKNEMLIFGIFMICILLECGMYLIFVPENSFEIMARVGKLLREETLSPQPLYNMMAAIKMTFHITIGQAVCLVLPVWFILNYNLLLLALGNELFTENKWKGLFVTVASIVVLFGAYDTVAPNNALLHNLCDFHGVYLMLLAPVGVIFVWMLLKKQNRILWGILTFLSLFVGYWIEKESQWFVLLTLVATVITIVFFYVLNNDRKGGAKHE